MNCRVVENNFDKKSVKKEIVDTIERLCTGNPNTCIFGYCGFNFTCAKPHFKVEDLSDKKHSLKSTLKNVRHHERKKLGLPPPPPVHHPRKIKNRSPNNHKRSKSPFSWERVAEILGQDIREHDLIKGHELSLKKIERIDNWGDIIHLLKRRYHQVHKKQISLPNGRYLYWKFKDENNPDLEQREAILTQ